MSKQALGEVTNFLMAGGGRGLSVGEVSLLRLLGWFTNDKSGMAWACRETLALMSGLSVRRVSSSIGRLVDRGLVRREVRKTHHGDGWYYTLDNLTAIGDEMSPIGGGNRGRNVTSIGDKSSPDRGRNVTSIGDEMSPDKKEISIESVCENAGVTPAPPAHTQGVSLSAGSSPAGSSPFGVYDVGAAVSVLAVGDDPVPRPFVEDRARVLTEGGGVTDTGREVRPDGFVAHCRKWWTREYDRERWLGSAQPQPRAASLRDRAARFGSALAEVKGRGGLPSDAFYAKGERGAYLHGVDAIAAAVAHCEEGYAAGAWDFLRGLPDEKVRGVLAECVSEWSGGRAPADRFAALRDRLSAIGGAS